MSLGVLAFNTKWDRDHFAQMDDLPKFAISCQDDTKLFYSCHTIVINEVNSQVGGLILMYVLRCHAAGEQKMYPSPYGKKPWPL